MSGLNRKFSIIVCLVCCAMLVFALLTGAFAEETTSVSICIGQTKTINYSTGTYKVTSVSSSDTSIVSATFEIKTTTVASGETYTTDVNLTGNKVGKATVSLYSGTYFLGSISVSVTNHTLVVYPAVEPTCTKAGSETCFVCSACGQYFADVKGTTAMAAPVAVPATGHKEAVDAARPETCTTDGLTEGKHCWVCGEILVKQETIPALGHTVVVDPAVKETCTTAGMTEGKHCSVCNAIIVAQQTIPATGHTLTAHAKKDATCTEVGTEAYWTCSVCKKVFGNEAATIEIGAPTLIPAKGHTIVIDEKKEATATEKGLTEGKHCSTCGEVFVKQKEILPTVSEFVKRCYNLILGRTADEGGLSGWTYQLANGTANAAQIVSGFMNSPEYKGSGNTSDQTVEVLYNTMLDRASDPDGKKGWVDALNASNDDSVVINGFSGSKEFQDICKAYGITAGTVPVPTAARLNAFVERCYNQALNRASDAGGKSYWVNMIESKQQTPQQVATGFVMSPEMNAANKATSDPDALLDSMYRLYLGREADEGGKAYWKEKLAAGMTVEELNAGFAESAEFKGIVNGYGLE